MVRAINLMILCLLTVSGFAQVVQERNARGADRIIILKDGFRVPIRDTATAPALLNYSGDSSRGGVVYDSTLQKLCFWTGVRWVCLDDSATGSSIDTTSLSNRINLKLNISDTATMNANFLVGIGAGTNITVDNTNPRFPVVSASGGGGGVPSDSLAWRRVGITQRINTIGWMNIYNGTVGASSSGNAVDSANLIWGARAGQALTTGYRNIALGRGALKSTLTGHSLIAIGDSAMANGAVTHPGAIAIGQRALSAFAPHINNAGAIAIGQNALSNYQGSVSNGQGAIAIGQNAGSAFVGSGSNTFFLAIGRNALQGETGSVLNNGNLAIGDLALSSPTYTGIRNLAIGHQAGQSVTSGTSNIIIQIPENAGSFTTGSRNVSIGGVGSGLSTENDNVTIGFSARSFAGASNSVYIGSAAESGFTVGTQSTHIGHLSGRGTGANSTAVGFRSLHSIGGSAVRPIDSATAIGAFAGSKITTFGAGYTQRSASTLIGFQAGSGEGGASVYEARELIAIGVRAAINQQGNHNTAIGRVNLANTTGSNQLAIGGNGIGWIRQDVSGSLRRTLLNATTSNVTTFTPSTALEINGTNGAVLLPRLTTAQRDALTPTDGMQIYNTTTNKFQGRAGGAWVDLH
jgi:hypothetical protein